MDSSQNEKVIKDLEADNESLMHYIQTNPTMYELNQRILIFISKTIEICEKSEKPDKIRVMKILFKFLATPSGKQFITNQPKFIKTVKNKLQHLIVTAFNYPDFQQELLDCQKELDPDLYYINIYTKRIFDSYLHLQYNETGVYLVDGV
jgi:thiamine kinase-like enzyme